MVEPSQPVTMYPGLCGFVFPSTYYVAYCECIQTSKFSMEFYEVLSEIIYDVSVKLPLYTSSKVITGKITSQYIPCSNIKIYNTVKLAPPYIPCSKIKNVSTKFKFLLTISNYGISGVIFDRLIPLVLVLWCSSVAQSRGGND